MDFPVRQALREVRSKASELRSNFGANAQARALEWAAGRIEEALDSEGERLLSLPDASKRSGYTQDHLARLVRVGRIPDTRKPGTRGRIYIRVSDLPRRVKQAHDRGADVHELASRLFGGKEGRHGHP